MILYGEKRSGRLKGSVHHAVEETYEGLRSRTAAPSWRTSESKTFGTNRNRRLIIFEHHSEKLISWDGVGALQVKLIAANRVV